MDFVFDELRKALSEVMNEGPGWRSELEARKAQVEDELENLALAIRRVRPLKPFASLWPMENVSLLVSQRS